MEKCFMCKARPWLRRVGIGGGDFTYIKETELIADPILGKVCNHCIGMYATILKRKEVQKSQGKDHVSQGIVGVPNPRQVKRFRQVAYGLS